MVTGGHDVAEREDPVRQPIVLDDFRRDRHEGRIRERYADRLGLSAVGLPSPRADLPARSRETVEAELADPIGGDEGCHDPLTRPQPMNLGTDVLDDPHPLMPEPSREREFEMSPIRPEVRAADRGMRDPHDDVRRVLQPGIWYLIDEHPSGRLEDRGSHGRNVGATSGPRRWSSGRATDRHVGRAANARAWRARHSLAGSGKGLRSIHLDGTFQVCRSKM
jgi:hypothetical protein